MTGSRHARRPGRATSTGGRGRAATRLPRPRTRRPPARRSSRWRAAACRSRSASSARATASGRTSSSRTAARTCSSRASPSSTRRCGRSTRCSATNVTVRNVRIDSHGPNNDGCDPESCRDVLIEGCAFDTGDDCIALKSGRNDDGRRSERPDRERHRPRLPDEGRPRRRRHRQRDLGRRAEHLRRALPHGQSRASTARCASRPTRCAAALIEHVYMRDVQVGQVAEAVVTIDFYYEEADQRRLPPDGARRRSAERHEPEERLRPAAARLPAGADSRRAPGGLHVRRRREAGPCSRP